ncbi:ATP-binding protein [Streptomyces sp. NPDC007084]|uniref:ATP-binding protein n=1 Tax=Streptomyces sp. NPDC007084 TaxID=3154313 RepID=UPI003456D3A6
MPRHARSVGRARTLLREQARSWGLSEDVTETAELLLSELMTNAYGHAKSSPGREIWARCRLTEDRLRVIVSDAGDTLPVPREVGPEDESGRGLTLVAALADKWGAQWRTKGVGKEVWFELRSEDRVSGGTKPRPGGAEGRPGDAEAGLRPAVSP